MILALSTAFILTRQAPLTLPRVLEEVRKAVHFDAYKQLPRGIEIRGDAKAWGETGTFTLLYSPDKGYLLTHSMSALGKTPQRMALDGRRYWSSDWSGATATMDPGSGEEKSFSVDATTHGWLSPARGYTITLGSVSEQKVNLKLASPGQYLTATVEIDRNTWLPQSMTVDALGGPQVITLSGYGPELGITLPHAVTATNTLTVRSVEAPKVSPNLKMPAWEPRDTTFDPKKPAALESRRSRSGGHILVRAVLNGKEGWFILDSGAGSTVVDQSFANQANLPKVGQLQLMGIGGTVTQHYRPVAELTLGPVTIKDVLMGEIDLSTLGDSFGVKLAGIIGYDVFRRTVVEIDAAGEAARIYDPALYQLKKGNWQTLGLARHTPYVTADFGPGRYGHFRLDSGAVSNVIFHEPAVRKYRLAEGQQTQATGVGGVGGGRSASKGTIDTFTLGPKVFEKPTVTFAAPNSGLLSDPFLAGNIGLPFFEPFVVVFDYTRYRVAFVPR